MTQKGRVSPFGDLRIKAHWRLPEAFRSLSRPSSPLNAKASTKCPYLKRLIVITYREQRSDDRCQTTDVRRTKSPNITTGILVTGTRSDNGAGMTAPQERRRGYHSTFSLTDDRKRQTEDRIIRQPQPSGRHLLSSRSMLSRFLITKKQASNTCITLTMSKNNNIQNSHAI